MTEMIKKYRLEIIGSLFCLTLGLLSGYGVKAGDATWYSSLVKPTFTAPNWVFGPAWTILYLMMGAALGKLWKNKAENKTLLILFAVQFIFNLAWTPLFFYLERIDLALYDICLLWVSLILFMILSFRIRTVFLLFLPYVLWVSFASILNFSIYQMNVL